MQIAGENNKIIQDKVRDLDQLVAYCQLMLIEKARPPKAYLNMKIRETETDMIKTVYTWLDGLEGVKRQFDPPPLRPGTRAIRNTIPLRR